VGHRARWVVASLILVYGCVTVASNLGFANWGGTVGATFAGGQVVGVLAGSPAARAGIRVGDRADLRRADTTARMFIAGDTLLTQGERLTLPIVDQGHTAIRSIVAMPTTPLGRITVALVAVSAIAYSLLAAWLVVGSGTITAYALALFALSLFQSPLLDVFGPLMLPMFVIISLISALAPLGLVVFALHACDEVLSRPRRVLQAIAILATIPFLIAMLSESLGSVILPGYRVAIDDRYVAYGPAGFTTVAFLILIARYFRNPDMRSRIAWLLPSMAVLLLISFPQPAYADFLSGTAINTLPLLAVVLLTYAILKSHLIDVRFVVSRAVVYGSLTSAALALIGLLDWVLGGVLASSRLALPIEAVVAVGIGFWLNALHGRVENLVETLLFRTRRRAEERLARIARGLERSDDPSLIAVGLVDEAASALELASAALFDRSQDGTFSRVAAIGWSDDHASVLGPHDPFILELAGADGPFRLEGGLHITGAPSDGLAKPRLAVPIRCRGTLVAFTLYGSHVGGADLDPAETQLVARVADAAAYDYDRADAAHLREVVAELQAALAALDPDYTAIGDTPSRRMRSGSSGATVAGGT
jgi:hypothetical protein